MRRILLPAAGGGALLLALLARTFLPSHRAAARKIAPRPPHRHSRPRLDATAASAPPDAALLGAVMDARRQTRGKASIGSTAQAEAVRAVDDYIKHYIKHRVHKIDSEDPAVLGAYHARRARGPQERLQVHSNVCVQLEAAAANDSAAAAATACVRGGAAPASPRLTKRVTFVAACGAAAAAAEPRAGLTWIFEAGHSRSSWWANPCHWANPLLPFWSAVHDATPAQLPALAAVLLYQVERTRLRVAPAGDAPAGDTAAGAEGDKGDKGDAAAAGGGVPSDWFEGTLSVALTELAQRRAAPAAALLTRDDATAAGGALCFERVLVVSEQMRAPHLYSAATARALRDAALRRFALPGAAPPPAAGVPLPATLFLRTTDRKIRNEAAFVHEARAWAAAAAVALAPVALRAGLALREQLRLWSGSRLVASMHGAQLTNVVFMPDGGAMLELFSCGHYSDTYRVLALEAELHYFSSRDGRDGCARNLGKLFHNADRNVTLAELRPLLAAAAAAARQPLLPQPAAALRLTDVV